MADNGSILVTGAAGQLGAVGRTVTGLLLGRGLPVRAMVRRADDRAAALRAAGAEVVLGDLLEPGDVYRVVSGCRRVYFGMSVSAGYLEATVTMAAVAREVGVNALVNMSQMTVSEMSIQNTTPSRFKRSIFSSLLTMPPPVTMIASSVVSRPRTASASALRNLSSPCLTKISGIDIPNFEATISSVSSNASLVRRCRQRPTEDFPAPIIPTRTIDLPPLFTGQISH